MDTRGLEDVGADGASFDAFVGGRSAALLRSAYLLTGDAGRAEDLLQTALAKVWPRWQQVNRGGDGEAYVRRVLYTTYVSWWHRRWNAETPVPEPPDRPDLPDAYAEADRRSALLDALAELPRRQRAIVVLRYFEDLTEPERAAARLLGRHGQEPARKGVGPTAYVCSALHRGGGAMTDDFEGGLRVALRDASGGLPDNPNRLAEVAARRDRDRRRRVGAIAAALVLVLGTSLLAGLAINRDAAMLDLPTSGAAEAYGRVFVPVEATNRGVPWDFPGHPPTFTFDLHGSVEVNGCNYVGGDWRLADGRFEWVVGPIWGMAACSGQADEAIDTLLSELLDHRPSWQLDGDTLKLRSANRTMTLVDRGEGRDPGEVLGHQFVAGSWTDTRPKSPRFVPNVWARISISPAGRIRASLACQSVEADAEIGAGTLVITDELNPRTQPCSTSMEAQQTEWFWELLRQPLRWQIRYGSLELASETNSVTLTTPSEIGLRIDRSLLRGKTFRSVTIEGDGAKGLGLSNGRGVTVTVDTDGNLTAGVGCDRPTVRAEVREGWLRHRPSDIPRDDCANPAAEEWLDDLLAEEPYWFLSKRHLVIKADKTRMDLLTDEQYRKKYGG